MELEGTIGGEERVGVDENCKIEEEEEVDERGEDGGIIWRAREGERGGDRDREGEDMYDGDREEWADVGLEKDEDEDNDGVEDGEDEDEVVDFVWDNEGDDEEEEEEEEEEAGGKSEEDEEEEEGEKEEENEDESGLLGEGWRVCRGWRAGSAPLIDDPEEERVEASEDTETRSSSLSLPDAASRTWTLTFWNLSESGSIVPLDWWKSFSNPSNLYGFECPSLLYVLHALSVLTDKRVFSCLLLDRV